MGLPACAPARAPIRTEADFTGFVTEIDRQPGPSGPGHIRVESDADKLVTRVDVAVTRSTLMFRKDGDALLPADFGTLEDKVWVRVWFAPPNPGSGDPVPAQATATQIVILGRTTADWQD